MAKQPDTLLRWRKEFPILETTTYLISNSLGAMPRSVSTRMQEYTETWAARGVRAWGDSWWEMPVTAGNAIAPLIGAKDGEVSMHPNISLMESILISSFDFLKKKNEIVYSDMEFPSVMYVYEQFAASQGGKSVIVRSEDGMIVPTEKLLDAINDRTLLVPISHVLFKSAYIQDIKAITEKAHKHGAVVILDAYHSVGIIPVDVRKLGVDILVGGVLKWLCGGPGGAFLWIRPSLRKKLQPKITGWVAHKHPFGFETDMTFSDDATRFLNGTPAIPALYAATDGAKIIASIGVERIREKSMRQTALIIDEAKKCGYTIVSPSDPKRRGGTVSVSMPNSYEISRELITRDILVDYREGAGIRIAPHFYTSDDEILYAMKSIGEILNDGSYCKHAKKREKVT